MKDSNKQNNIQSQDKQDEIKYEYLSKEESDRITEELLEKNDEAYRELART